MNTAEPGGKIEVRYLSHMGSDAEVCADARVSFDEDEGAAVRPRLIRYLAEHGHWSPFSHQFVKFRVTAPLYVARQLWKSHVGFTGGDAGEAAWNEVSMRYVDDRPAFHLPDAFRSRPPGSIKQGSGGEHPSSDHWRQRAASHFADAAALYDEMIADGVAPEQARSMLPNAAMTSWRWTGSLVAWARLCRLRLAADAQAESAEVARQISAACLPLFPLSWSALMEDTP